VNLLALAVLLHRHRSVLVLGRATVITAVIAGGISFEVAKTVPITPGHGSRVADLTQLALVSITWAAVAGSGCCGRLQEICGGARGQCSRGGAGREQRDFGWARSHGQINLRFVQV
jgi:hypothetical protein